MSIRDDINQSQLHISVRNLVEFIFREGDIDNRSGKLVSPDAMTEGTRIHRQIQKSMGEGYQAEVPLKITFEEEGYSLTLEGRADGIFINEDEVTVIDEIKGIYRRLDMMEEPVYVHKAQAMCYAYIVAVQSDLPQIGIQMTYCNLDTNDIKRFTEIYEFAEVEQWFKKLLEKYKRWADFQISWRKIRKASIKTLDFPYPYREGQKELVSDVYRTILRKKNLFIQAPTGVGKTISTVYPAVKAVGEDLADRVFYLTAKTITGTVARDTFQLLEEKGYRGKIIQLTAKEKMCLCEEMECNPINCPYAKGHYDRVNDAVYDTLQKADMFTREFLLEQAQLHCVCPFEFSLDVATWADDIICDYNYVFDPTVYLKRFFQEGVRGDYIFLVDEAHNLVERSREMYSAVLVKEDVLNAKKLLKPYHHGLEKLLDRCNKQLLEYKRECNGYHVYDNLGSILYTLMNIASMLDDFLQKPADIPGRKEILDFYFSIRNFLSIYDLVDENYVIYSEIREDGSFMIKLFCVDPSKNLQKCLDKGNATIFFSATLLPINYYKELLSTRKDNYAIYAKSTFSKEQSLLLFARDVSTKYTRRNRAEFLKIASYIKETVKVKKGNYMAFFPSYQLMHQVYEEYEKLDGISTVILQENNMKEKEREQFLEEFEKEREESLLAFCVMGGIFGEGIDLKNDKLIGAIVVGTGLPQISNEREILKNFYDEKSGNGFDFAFRYPGMNKVLQAAGRVIRTTEDCGVILLLDERFLQSDYDSLYPREWDKRETTNLLEISSRVEDFWRNQEKNV